MKLSGNRLICSQKQFLHGLNDEEMLAEIIRELVKCDENMTILSECVLTLAKRIEAQRAQMLEPNNNLLLYSGLHILKFFDAIKHKDGKQRETRPTKTVTTSARKKI